MGAGQCEEDEAKQIEMLKEAGVTWNGVDLEAFQEACAPVYDWIVEEYGADPELHSKLTSFIADMRKK